MIHASLLHADSLINISVDNELYTFSDDIYNFIARLVAKGAIEDFPKNIFPYSRGEVARILTDLSLKVKRGEIRLSVIEEERLKILRTLFSKALGETEVQKTKKPLFHTEGDEYYLSMGGGLTQKAIYRGGKGFPKNGETSITSLLPGVSGQIGDSFAFSSDMKWEFHVGDIFVDLFPDQTRFSYPSIHMENIASTQAYGKFKLPWFELELGKDNMRWGPGYHGQLMISDNPQPMDMIELEGRYGRIGFQAFTAKLGSDIGDKYISAHRIECIVWKGMDLGLSEVIVYGDRFETNYLNPFQVYLITQLMSEAPARTVSNVLASVDFSYRIIDRFQIYGELAVDDAAPIKEPLNHWDTKFGILTGLYIVDPFSLSDTDLRIEYVFINQYCYTHEKPINAYKHFSSSIGHWLGSDADDLWCELKHRFTSEIESIFAYELERHGEGSINKAHPNDAPANDRWTFLSGTTQSKHSVSLGVSYTKVGYYSLKAKYTHSWLKNIGNYEGRDDIGKELILEGSRHF